MIRKNKFLLANLIVILLTVVNLYRINEQGREKILEYSTMLASKITKYVIANSYQAQELNFEMSDIYDIVKNDDGEIKILMYNTKKVNELLNSMNNYVHRIFHNLELGDLEGLDIRENILTNQANDWYHEGIVVEVPIGMVTDNFLFTSLGPRIPVKISLTGEMESHVSTEVEEYGINNAMISMYIHVTVAEQITLPFITKKIEVENSIPLSIGIMNGKIPNYYLGGFERSSNLYAFRES